MTLDCPVVNRSSHRRCSMKRGVLKYFANFEAVLKSLFNEVAGLKTLSLKSCNFINFRNTNADVLL